MTKTEAIRLLGGTGSSAARAVGITPQAVRDWPDELTPAIRDRVQAALWRQEQAAASLLGRLDAPSVVPPHVLRAVLSYRHAVRLCWALRRASHWGPLDMARHCGFTRQHVSDWLQADDAPTRRSLPAGQIAAFESACGNTLVTQWLAAQARLTVLEELQASRAA